MFCYYQLWLLDFLFLCVWIDAQRQWNKSLLSYLKPFPHIQSLNSQVGCHLKRTPRSRRCRTIHGETCLFFLQVHTLFWRSTSWIQSLSAQSYPERWLPSNPASHSFCLHTDAYGWSMTEGGWKAPSDCKSVTLIHCTCCWLNCWLKTWQPSHLTSHYVLLHLWRFFIVWVIRFGLQYKLCYHASSLTISHVHTSPPPSCFITLFS